MYVSEPMREYYNRYGEREWQRLERNVHGIVEYEVTLHILKKHLPENAHILDAGGGPGRYAIALARMGHRVSLIDLSDEQLRIARERIDEADVQDRITEIRRLDICDLSELSDASFDAVLCLGGALSYVRDGRFRALRELIRVAKPDSPLILSVMSLLGTFHLISTFDGEDFLSDIRDHVHWDPDTPFPEVLDSVVGSPQWHAPMTLYTSTYMDMLLRDNGCSVIEMAASHTIISSYVGGLDKVQASPEALEMLLRLERAFCTKPGLVDMGQRLIAVAVTPGS